MLWRRRTLLAIFLTSHGRRNHGFGMSSLTKTNLFSANRAIYLPAITSTFARFAHNCSFARSLPVSSGDLNFLNPSNPLFAYPFALYSAS